MKLLPRLIVLFLLLLIIQVAAFAITRAGTPRGMEVPATELREMPLELGDWTCNNPGQRDADAEDLAKAAVSMQRVYRNADERVTISTYVAIWTAYEGVLPHPPEVCYKVNGHKIINTRRVEIERPDGSTMPATLMAAEIDNQPVHVLYWYQLGHNTALDRASFREARLSFWGAKSWPPLVKIMLDVRGMDDRTAGLVLSDLGERILDWTSTKL